MSSLRIEFLFELLNSRHEGVRIVRRRLQLQVLTILLQRQLTVLQILMRHNCQVKEGGTVIRLLFERLVETLCRFAGPATLEPSQAQPVQRLRVVRTQPQRVAEALLRRARVTDAQLYGAEFEETLNHVWPAQRVCGELGLGRLEPVLPHQQAAEIVTGLTQIVVKRQRFLVSPLSLSHFLGLMVSQTQIIPRQRVGAAEQGVSRNQFLDCLRIFSLV